MRNNKSPGVDRRRFLTNILKVSGQVTLASSALYTISLISGEGRFGGMTAGAKCCPGRWVVDGANCLPHSTPSAAQCALGGITTGRTGCYTDWSWRCN